MGPQSPRLSCWHSGCVREDPTSGPRSGDDHDPGRWERLFAELDAEQEHADRVALQGEVADRSRREFSELRLVDRLRAAVGHPLTVHLPGGDRVDGVLRDTGADWLLLEGGDGREALVPLAAVTGLVGVGFASAVPGSEGVVGARLTLRSALRRLVRDRAPVGVVLLGGAVVHGTCDRVGADFVEIAEHPVGEPRRAAAVRSVRTVPLAALSCIRAG